MDSGWALSVLKWIASILGGMLSILAGFGLWLHRREVKRSTNDVLMAQANLIFDKRLQELEREARDTKDFKIEAGKKFVELQNIGEKVDGLDERFGKMEDKQDTAMNILFQIKGHLKITD
jgi:hypothetical protein